MFSPTIQHEVSNVPQWESNHNESYCEGVLTWTCERNKETNKTRMFLHVFNIYLYPYYHNFMVNVDTYSIHEAFGKHNKAKQNKTNNQVRCFKVTFLSPRLKVT